MNITHTINSLPTRAGKTVLKSLVASLNQSIIGYARSHIRAEKYAAPVREVLPSDKLAAELAAEHGTPTFDDHNEAEIKKLAEGEGNDFIKNAGLPVADTPLELCQRFTTLRNWLEEMLEGMADFDPVYNAPFTVANSLVYQIERIPQPNMDEIRAKAILHNIPVASLISRSIQAAMDNFTELTRDQARILGIYESCSLGHEDMRWVSSDSAKYNADDNAAWGREGKREVIAAYGATSPDEADAEFAGASRRGSGYSIPVETDEGLGFEQVDDLIAQLPVAAQFKMCARMVTLMDDAMGKAMDLMLRPRQRGSDAAGEDYDRIRALRNAHLIETHAFDKKNCEALDEFANRGGWLPELPNNPLGEIEQIALLKQAEELAKLKAAATGDAYRAQMLATGPAISAMETAAAAKRKAVMAAFEMEPVVEVAVAPVKPPAMQKSPAPVMSKADAAFAKFAGRNTRSV